MFIIKQHDNVTWSGRKTRVDKQDLANATTCLDMTVWSVSESFSTQYFTFKITSRLAAIPQARSLQNAVEVTRHTRISFVVLPPRLDHIRLYYLLLWGWVMRMHWNCMWKSNVGLAKQSLLSSDLWTRNWPIRTGMGGCQAFIKVCVY